METKKLTVTTVHTGLTIGSHAYCCGSKWVTFGFNISTYKHTELTLSPFNLQSHTFSSFNLHSYSYQVNYR
jgi:hypothetical protein